ncbi:peritrophin-1-like [Megachile rotundata]|uniref:peritrophin-1-like n=1 Tax=Megachile rotundata TaxID=143995 RepID=UPI003FD5379F
MKVLLFTLLACVVYINAQNDIQVKCPELKEKDPLLVSHPCDCNTYYVCTPPGPTPMPCPRGLQFYPPRQRCEWPWIAKCVPQAGCPAKPLDAENEFFEEPAHL